MPTAKVTPHSLDPQLSQPSFKNASEQDTKEDIIIEKHLNDEKPLIQQQKSKLDGKLPISVFIIILISSLLVLSCLLIWVSSNALSRQAIEELSSEVIDISGEKLTLYLDSLLDPLGRLSRVVASDYNNGIANLSNYRKYLFPKYSQFITTSCGYFFGYPSSKYTYSTTGTGANVYLVYSYQPPGYIGTIRDTVNSTTGAVTKVNSTVDLTPFFSAQQDYYNSTIQLSKILGTEGVYGAPYKALNSSMAIYYSAVLYDPTLFALGVKNPVGVSRINMSLGAIVDYLSKIVLLGTGYVLVAQTNGVMIGGSINTVSGDGTKVLNIFNVTERNAGTLMMDVQTVYGDIFSLSSRVTVSSLGVDYIVSPYDYKIENLKWKVFFIVYQEDVMKAVTLNTGVSIAVAVVIILVGIVISVIIGIVISRPMKHLKAQFSFIKRFDLDDVQLKSSLFSEVNSIFSSLEETVGWLSEIKAFIPAAVLEQIQECEEVSAVTNEVDERTKTDDLSSKPSMSKGSGLRSFLSAASRVGGGTTSLFQMGLFSKTAVIVYIKLHEFTTFSHQEISDLFTKIVNSVGPLTKLYKANFHLISCEEFQLTLSVQGKPIGIESKLFEKGLECALKVRQALERVNPKLVTRIGVAGGMVKLGNLGTSSTRYHSVVGELVSESKQLACIAHVLDVVVAANEAICNSEMQSRFILRPIDRVRKDQNSNQTVFEVIGNKNGESDEWMYELEQKKNNNKFENFQKAFAVFYKNTWNDIGMDSYKELIDTSIATFSEHLQSNTKDFTIINRLLAVLIRASEKEKNDQKSIPEFISQYHSEIHTEMIGRSDNDEKFNSCEVKGCKKFEIAAVPGASVTVGKNSKQNITQSEVSGNEFPEGLCCYALNLSSGFLPTDKFLEFRTSALKSVIGGSNHLFLWLDDNTSSLRVQEPNPNVIVRVRHNLFAVGANEYGQCGSFEQSANTFSELAKVDLDLTLQDCEMLLQSELDLLRKASNQVWRLENVFSKCNYSFFLISTKGEYNLTLLTASGWNYSGCTGTGVSGSSSVTKRRPVLFGNSIFPPNNEEIYQAYPGGCNTVVLTRDRTTRKQFVYVCGETSRHIDESAHTYNTLTLCNILMQFIGSRSIQKIVSAYGATHLLLSDGNLYSWGNFPLSASGLHVIDPSVNLANETILDFKGYEDLFAIVTDNGLWVTHVINSNRSLAKYQISPRSIIHLETSTSEESILVVTDINNIHKLPLSRQGNELLTLDDLKNKCTSTQSHHWLDILAEKAQRNDVQIDVFGIHGMFVVFTSHRSKLLSRQRMMQRLHNQTTCYNPFIDVVIL